MSRGLEEDVVDLTVAVGRAREDVASAAQATRGWPARATRDMKRWRPWGGGRAMEAMGLARAGDTGRRGRE